jgi:hypothetical protein
LLAVPIKLGVNVALVIIQHKYPLTADSTRPSYLIKVFKLFQTRFIISLTILGSINNLVRRYITVLIPGRKVESTSNTKERRHYMAVCCNRANRYSLFPITRLNKLWIRLPIKASNNYHCVNYTYYKAGLVKVVEVGILDAVLRPYICN